MYMLSFILVSDLVGVLVRVSILAQTSWPRSKLERKGFIHLTLPHCCLSPRKSGLELKQVRKQELMQRPWRDVLYWLASSGLLSLLSFFFPFFIRYLAHLHFPIAVHHWKKSGLELKQVRKQELMQKPWRDVLYWLASSGLLSLLSYRTKTTSPEMVPPTRGLSPLITNWENALQLDLMEAFPQMKFLSLW